MPLGSTTGASSPANGPSNAADQLTAQLQAAGPDDCLPILQRELWRVAEEIQKATGPGADATACAIAHYKALFNRVVFPDGHAQKAVRRLLFQLFTEDPLYAHYRALPRSPCCPVRLVVFDKDGTLVRLGNTFGPWAEALVAALGDLLPPTVDVADLWTALGYDPVARAFAPTSIVASHTMSDICLFLCTWIQQAEGSRRGFAEVQSDVMKRWQPAELHREDVQPCGALQGLFAALHARGIVTAVCTADDRKPTLQTLEWLGLSPAIVVCGDDPISFKPSPEPLWQICDRAGVSPSAAVMIGDTPADVSAGLNAKFAHVIGVLSGSGKAADLAAADAVIPTVDSLLGMPFLT